MRCLVIAVARQRFNPSCFASGRPTTASTGRADSSLVVWVGHAVRLLSLAWSGGAPVKRSVRWL
jgi:hypothetical protein